MRRVVTNWGIVLLPGGALKIFILARLAVLARCVKGAMGDNRGPLGGAKGGGGFKRAQWGPGVALNTRCVEKIRGVGGKHGVLVATPGEKIWGRDKTAQKERIGGKKRGALKKERRGKYMGGEKII